MIKETLESIKDNIINRFSSPFSGAFFISWCLINWQIFVIVFSFDNSYTLNTKIATINFYLWGNGNPYYYKTLLLPFAISILYKSTLDFLNIIIDFLVIKLNNNFKPSDFIPITKYNLAIESLKETKSILDKIRTERDNLETENSNLITKNEKLISENRNSNILNYSNWVANSNDNALQKETEFKIDLSGKLLYSAECKITFINDYFRFGFKIGKKDLIASNPEKGVLNDGEYYLIHIAKELNSNDLFFAFYRNTNLIHEQRVDEYKIGDILIYSIVIYDYNNLQVFVNTKKIISEQIKYDLREKLYLLAWGDEHKFNFEVKDIIVKTLRN